MGKILTIIGLVGTAIYMVAIHVLIGDRYSTLTKMPLNELGDYFAGVFGPLAIFWLILGFFQQGKELQQNTEALELQATELEKSVEQQKELVAVTRKQVEADITALGEERQRIVSQAQPDFVVLRINSNGGSEAPFIAHIKNTGATVTQVTISTDNELHRLGPSNIPAWETNTDRNIVWGYINSVALDELIITIGYRDRSNNPGIKRFKIITTGVGVGLLAEPLAE